MKNKSSANVESLSNEKNLETCSKANKQSKNEKTSENLHKNISSKQMFSFFMHSSSVAIFGHINPDADSYGAMFALRDMCRNMGKKADCFAIKNAYCFLDEIFPLNEVRTDFSSQEFDLVVIVDLNNLTRVQTCFIDEIKKVKKVVNIDHHLHDTKITDNQIIDTSNAACCQMILHFMQENKQKVTPQIATYLWAGIIGDTGRFLHSNLTHEVLIDATQLFDLGADVQFVYDKMFRKNSLKDIEIQNKIISSTKFNKEKTVGTTIFTLKDIKKMAVDQEMIKKYTNLIINLDGVLASFLCMEYLPGKFKVSIRTKGINAQKFASTFGGGGHVCASGFNIDGNKRKVLSASKIWMKEILKF